MRKLSTATSSFLRWKSFVIGAHRLIVRGPRITSFLPSRSLAQVRSEPFSELWFTPSSPGRTPADDLLGFPGNGHDHKPPDERTVRLGKSMSRPIAHMSSSMLILSCSLAYPLSTPTKHPYDSTASRTPFALRLTPPISFNTPTPACRERESSLQSCVMDCASSLGLRTYRRQCQVANHI